MDLVYNLQKINGIKYESAVPVKLYTTNFSKQIKTAEDFSNTKYNLDTEYILDCEHRYYCSKYSNIKKKVQFL